MDWQNFAYMVNVENSTYGDKYYKLTADIGVTGNDTTSLPFVAGDASSRAFRGHFDGDGHTLTFNYGGAMEGAAPFRHVSGAVIENLTTAGTVSVAGKTFAAGIAGYIAGDATIKKCTSNVELHGSGSGVGQFGGFAGKVSSGVTLNINECTWGGSMTGSVTMNCGGFVGYNIGTVNITDCLCSPASITIGDGKVYAFVQNWTGGSYSLNNAYRTRDFSSNNNQGKRVYTTLPSDKVCKFIQIFNGDYYWQSGTAEITSLKASYPLAGESMALPSCGLTFDGETVESDCYTVSVKDSSGQTVNNITKADTYTLTVTGFLNYFGSTSKTFKVYSVDSIPYIDASGNEQEINSATQLASATLPEGDWWYVTGETTIDSRISISGTKHLILTDGAVLNIPKGIQLASGNTLNIYGQSENTGKLVINGVESENAGIGGNHGQSCGALTVNGGDITVTGGEYGAGIGGGGYSGGAGDTITINGGKVTAKGGSARTVGIGGGGVYYPGQTGGNGGTIIINGGIVSARGNENGAGMGGGINCSDKGTITINWKNASDRIYASWYNSNVTVNGDFVHEGTNTKATNDNIGDKTLVPAKTVTVGEVSGGTVVLNGAESGSLFGIGSTVNLTVTPDSGYVVTSVKYNSTEIEPVNGVYSFVMPAEDVTVSAEFENRYMITWIDGDDNTLKTDLVKYGTTPSYTGETPTKTEDTKYTYTFTGWSPEITSVTGDQTYTAQFSQTPKSYNVTYKVDGETYGNVDTVAYGTALTARDIPEASTGYSFSGWSDIPETMPDHDVVITGTFTQNDYNIAISDSIRNGSVSSDKATAHYNDNVILTVTPDTGYMLKSISGNNGTVNVTKYGSVTGEYNFTMPDGDVTVSAEFEQITYNLVPAKAASCTEDGNVDYYTGSDGKVYTMSDGVYTETTLAAVTIEATGHSYVVDHSDWTEVNDHYYVQIYGKCSVCGDEVDLGAENVYYTEGVVTKTATETEEGIMTYTATVSYYYNIYTATKEVAIPKIGTVAKIGDTEYSSLKDAIRNAEDKDVITLYADVNEPELYLGTYYKNITLDLNSHSVTLDTINIYGSLTVKNGTLTCYIDNGNGGNDNTLMLDNAVLNTGDCGIQWMAKHVAVMNSSTMNISGSASLGYGGEDDFDLIIDVTSKVVLNNTVPSGYNEELVRAEFGQYLPDGYSFIYDDEAYAYRIKNADGNIVTDPVILTNNVGIRLAGYSLSIQQDGDIGVNFYMLLSDNIVNNANSKMRFVIPTDSKKNETKTIDIAVSEATQKQVGSTIYYVFKCPVAAKEMTSVIKAQVYVGDTACGKEYSYTVKEYADYLIRKADANGTDIQKKYAKALPLVKAMLNYGASTQTLFGNNMDSLANAGVDYTGSSADEVKTAVEKVIKNGSLSKLDEISIGTGLTFEGASLNLGSKTAYTLHYTAADGADVPEITSETEGITVSKKVSDNTVLYYIKNIKAGHLLENITIKIGDTTLTVNPASYMYAALDTTEDKYANLRNAVAALYDFNNEAKTYETEGN